MSYFTIALVLGKNKNIMVNDIAMLLYKHIITGFFYTCITMFVIIQFNCNVCTN